jgi:hypothetical protein
MVEKKVNIWFQKTLFFIFGILVIWWIFLQASQFGAYSIQNQIFSSTYGVLALMGGVFGFWLSKKWGGIRSVMGKALFFFSLGLLGQFLGQLTYSAYVYYFKIEVPYPSLGDIPYFSTIVFYIFGLIHLARASGVLFNLRKIKYKVIAVIIPLGLLSVSYFLFLKGYEFDWGSPVKVFLDFGYPLGDAVYVGLALLVFFSSHGLLGGIMKSKIRLLIFALSLQFIGDFSFLYLSYYSTVTPAGINDFIVMVAYFFMNIALIQMYRAHIEISSL